jgi:hypothetical protein
MAEEMSVPRRDFCVVLVKEEAVEVNDQDEEEEEEVLQTEYHLPAYAAGIRGTTVEEEAQIRTELNSSAASQGEEQADGKLNLQRRVKEEDSSAASVAHKGVSSWEEETDESRCGRG